MPVILHASVSGESFQGGATYQTLVGDSQGSTPIRIGIQTPPLGYKASLHSHPYLQAITVLEGQGEAWMQDFDKLIPLAPGISEAGEGRNVGEMGLAMAHGRPSAMSIDRTKKPYGPNDNGD